MCPLVREVDKRHNGRRNLWTGDVVGPVVATANQVRDIQINRLGVETPEVPAVEPREASCGEGFL